MKSIVGFLGALILMTVPVGFSQAQDAGGDLDLSGTWRGKAVFMQTDGRIQSEQHFVFDQQSDGFVTGEHSWENSERKLRSNAGEGDTFAATERFLGIVDAEGDIWLVEPGDITIFRLRVVSETKIEFIALEGGPNAVVGRGELTRE